MYVCICNRVNDRQIKKLARQGCASLDELQEQTSLGNGCGCCLMEAEEILDEHRPQIGPADHGNRESMFPANGGTSFEPAV